MGFQALGSGQLGHGWRQLPQGIFAQRLCCNDFDKIINRQAAA
jgi:hypothetical protein